jgi:tRNA dimethylallyltransferase
MMPDRLRLPLVVVVGPTGVGKSGLAISLAKHFDIEIVSADSRQIYRQMDIGTAKSTTEELAAVRHHLIDIVDPDKPFTAADYQRQANAAIADIAGRGRIPVLVGGTGFYVQAITAGLHIPTVPPDQELRAKLEAKAISDGLGKLVAELEILDPLAAARIDQQNPRRVIRALEVCLLTGQPFSAQQSQVAPPYRILKIGITRSRQALYARIDSRVDSMMAAGLLEEVQGLIARGYRPDLPSMSGIGYRQLGWFLKGDTTLCEAVQRIKYATHRYARQQYTWFRLDDSTIHWLDLTIQSDSSAVEQIVILVKSFLSDEV